ncbi:MAG: hypothetical protein QNJ90_05160 [Planctomycetota bacterium]|nr:hypothetical protein [Planctomycetota bacterium]
MASRARFGLMLLGLVALACVAYVVLGDDDADVSRGGDDLTADGGSSSRGDPDGGLSARGTAPPMNNGRAPMRPGGTNGGGGNSLVRAREPSGIDYSDPAVRESELRRMLGGDRVDDWRKVAKIVGLMQPGERIPEDLRGVILRELEGGKRLQVMHVFAQLRDETFVEDLFEVLERAEAPSGHVRAALEAIWKMPGGDSDEIARRLESSLAGDTQKDVPLLRAIGKRGGPEAARALVEYLQRVKNPSDVQMHVLQSLDVSTDKAAAEIVADALKREGSPKVQRALIAMVMRPGASAMTAPLMGLDRSGVSDDVRAMAIKALGRIADVEATGYLLKKAGEPGVFGERALTAIQRMSSADPKVGALLSRALGEADNNPRPTKAKASLLEALGTAGHAPSLPVIVRSLADRDDTVQTAAIRAMGRMGSKAEEYVPRLGEMFEGQAGTRQRDIAVALSNIGGKQAVDEMRRLLKIEGLDPSVRRNLQIGLRNAESKLPQETK